MKGKENDKEEDPELAAWTKLERIYKLVCKNGKMYKKTRSRRIEIAGDFPAMVDPS